MQLSAKQLDAILSSMGEGLLVVNREYQVILMNQAGGILLWIAPSEAVGKGAEEVFPLLKDGKPLEPKGSPILKAIQEANIIHVGLKDNLSCKSKMGNVFPIAMVVAPLLEEEVTGAVILFRDVSEEKEIDWAKTEFVSMASHQLRTPVATANWYTEMLLAGDAGEVTQDQKQFLQEIYHANKRMVELVNALLNVSRIELGTFAVEPKPVNLTDLIKSVLEELRPQINEKRLEIQESYTTPTLSFIEADPRLLRIVIQNLLSNAVKFSNEGGSIHVGLALKGVTNSEENTPKGLVLFTVQDSGCGIPESQQSRIFTKLFRADNVRDREGTGLGLYITKSILDHTGGNIWFESRQNAGATFYVSLPVSGIEPKAGTKELVPPQTPFL